MSAIHAYVAREPGKPLETFEYDPGELGPQQVEIAVESCGICHSDLSMIDNEWQMTAYPIVAGHEAIGKVTALGSAVPGLEIGQRVGVGWFSGSCMACPQCLDGKHNLCAHNESTIVGRHGGFADRLRSHWSWATPLPEGVASDSAGPLFCGGITVFSPIFQNNVLPTDRVGVVGIGGLGHMALQFLSKWGCEVTAFTSSANKADEARKFGAHRVVNSRDEGALVDAAQSLDFLLVTVNVPLDWNLYLSTLRPGGRFHVVGAVLEPMQIPAMALIMGARSVSGSPMGSPAETRKMLEFCARHEIAPQIETYPMSKVNEALDHLRAGKARYRVVLKSDF